MLVLDAVLIIKGLEKLIIAHAVEVAAVDLHATPIVDRHVRFALKISHDLDGFTACHLHKRFLPLSRHGLTLDNPKATVLFNRFSQVLNSFAHASERNFSEKMEGIMDSNRKLEGARAFNRGIERDRCPHAPGTVTFQGWMVGWKQQKAEFEQRLHHEHSALMFAKAS